VKKLVAAVAAALAMTGCAVGGKSEAAPTPSVSSGAPTPTPPKAYKTPPPVLPVPGYAVTMSTADAPWPAPAIVDNGAHSADYVAAAGLPYAEEMLQIHYHAHLDVIVDGKAVPVPAYLGFVAKGHSAVGLAPLHTHDFSGVIHIENNVPADFLLGQVFVEWGVRFSSTCLGSYCTGGGKELAVFVNGQKQTGDPTRIVLAKHQEIAVVYGTPDQLAKPPSSYHFTNGL